MPTQDIKVTDAIADTEFTLLDSVGNLIEYHDVGSYETWAVQVAPGTYYLHVTDWGASDPSYHEGGEYALRVSAGGLWSPTDPNEWYFAEHWDQGTYPIAPGTFANPVGGAQGAQATSMEAATAVTAMDTIYYACFFGPLYGNPPGATDGLVGHFYKIVVQ
jgi:hypothetical protein